MAPQGCASCEDGEPPWGCAGLWGGAGVLQGFAGLRVGNGPAATSGFEGRGAPWGGPAGIGVAPAQQRGKLLESGRPLHGWGDAPAPGTPHRAAAGMPQPRGRGTEGWAAEPSPVEVGRSPGKHSPASWKQVGALLSLL